MIWLMLLLITVWPAIMLAIMTLLCICCAPCMFTTIRDYYNQRNEEQNERDGVIDKMVLRKFNPEEFK